MKKGPKRDWAERAGERISEKTRLMYCEHFDGAHCDACAPKVITAALRRAEKRGYERGLNARDPMTGIRTDSIRYTGPHGKLMKARQRDRSEG